MKLVGPAPVDADEAVTVEYLDDLLANYTPGGGGSIAAAYAGLWDAGTAYTAGQIVTSRGSSWLATADSLGSAPLIGSSSWTLLAGGLHFAGEWDPATVYQLGDVVGYQGGSYIGLQATTAGLQPGDANYWMPLAGGGSRLTPVFKSGTDYTANANEFVFVINGGADRTITLPANPADGDMAGAKKLLMDDDEVIVAGAFYEGPGDYRLGSFGEAVTFIGFGGQWYRYSSADDTRFRGNFDPGNTYSRGDIALTMGAAYIVTAQTGATGSPPGNGWTPMSTTVGASGRSGLVASYQSADYTAAVGDFVVAIGGDTSPITITLPTGDSPGQLIIVRRDDDGAAPVYVKTEPGQTINGADTVALHGYGNTMAFWFWTDQWMPYSEAGAIRWRGEYVPYDATAAPDARYYKDDIVTHAGVPYVYTAALSTTSAAAAPDPALFTPMVTGSAAGAGYLHTQGTAATVWQISHGLGFDPAGLTVIDAAGDTIDGAAVQYLVAGQTLRLSFDISIAGTAYLS